MTTPSKIIDIDFASNNIVNNSTELIISTPDNVQNATIYSQSMVSMESNTLTRNVAVTLNCLNFDASKKEYIKLKNDLKIPSNITICFWVYIKNDSLALNNSILDFSYKNSKGQFSNVLAVKTDKNRNIVFIVNNSYVFLKCNLDQWTHYTWTLSQNKSNPNLADWNISTNGKMEPQVFKKLYLNTGLVLNNNLIGKSESDKSLLYFNGKLGGITIYNGILSNSNLDIYRDDPTIKYLQPMVDELYELYGKESFQNINSVNTFKYDLYDNNTYLMDIETTNQTNNILDKIITTHNGNTGNINTNPPPIPVFTQDNNYENTGLGILFICITIIIYKYF